MSIQHRATRRAITVANSNLNQPSQLVAIMRNNMDISDTVRICAARGYCSFPDGLALPRRSAAATVAGSGNKTNTI